MRQLTLGSLFEGLGGWPKPLPGYQLVDLYNGITMDGYPFQSYRQLDLFNEVWPRK